MTKQHYPQQDVPSQDEGDMKPPSLHKLMREDWDAAFERDPSALKRSYILLYSTGTHIVWSYRRSHWLYEHGHKRMALWLAKRTRRKLGADIHPGATIGRRFTIDHGVGVVIGETAIVGDDCLLYQGVTLGMTGKHGGKRHPTLGNNVMVGANATVLGNITIGDNVRVGAGSVVVKDVPADVTVAGVPARIVRDRRYRGPSLVGEDVHEERDDGPSCILDALEDDGENVRWSCAL